MLKGCDHTVGKVSIDEENELILLSEMSYEIFSDPTFEAFSYCKDCGEPIHITCEDFED